MDAGIKIMVLNSYALKGDTRIRLQEALGSSWFVTAPHNYDPVGMNIQEVIVMVGAIQTKEERDWLRMFDARLRSRHPNKEIIYL